MKEYRQSKNSLKKQISLLLPIDIYEGARRDSQKYNRSMAYHIVETLRLTFDKSIKEVQAEREAAAKVQVFEQMKEQATAEGRSEEWLLALEQVFKRFAETKSAEDFTEAFQKDLVMFTTMMLEVGEPSQQDEKE
jgi:hypothetical protein